VRDLTDLMMSIGFVNVEYVGETKVSTSQFTAGGLFRAVKVNT
jgi:hypothetical protein